MYSKLKVNYFLFRLRQFLFVVFFDKLTCFKPTTRAGVGCLLFSFACSTVMFPAYISGSSMAPTIQNAEWALILSLPHQWIKHGDVITLQ